MYNRVRPRSGGYKHFNSLLNDFYAEFESLKVASVNNHLLDFNRLGSDYRISRFIRDPRDLIVSGYFYHQRAAEEWCSVINPNEKDWAVVNGNIPDGLNTNDSYASFLSRIDKEAGLIAEIQFRKKHFQDMIAWPSNDPKIRVYTYENMMGNEVATFKDLMSFYELSYIDRWIGIHFAKKYAASSQSSNMKHIRNTKPAQWKEHFTPAVTRYFNDQYGELLTKYGYEILD